MQELTTVNLIVSLLVNAAFALRNVCNKSVFLAMPQAMREITSLLLLLLASLLGMFLSLAAICVSTVYVGPPIFSWSTFAVGLTCIGYTAGAQLALSHIQVVSHSILELGKRVFVLLIAMLAANDGHHHTETGAIPWRLISGSTLAAIGGVAYLIVANNSSAHRKSIDLAPKAKDEEVEEDVEEMQPLGATLGQP